MLFCTFFAVLNRGDESGLCVILNYRGKMSTLTIEDDICRIYLSGHANYILLKAGQCI
jgi:hypothetical protein